MKSLHELIEALREDPLVKEFKALEKEVLGREKWKKAYERVLEKQRRYVKERARGGETSAQEAQEVYEKARQELENIPAVRQYLNLQEILEEELGLLFRLIEDDLNDPGEHDL